MAIENPYLKFINDDGSINPVEKPNVKELLQLKGLKKLTPELTARNQQILDLYNQGYNQSEIAKAIGISRERIRQLLPIGVAKERAKQKKEFIEYYELVKQVLSVLRQFAIWSRHDLQGYRRGCKCDKCMAANNKQRKNAYYKSHDKALAYSRKWQKENREKQYKYMRKWKKNILKKAKAGEVEFKHNTTGYTIGCRCPICTAANTNAKKKYRERKRQQTKEVNS